MESVKDILMKRDNMSSEDADDLIAEFRDCLQEVIDEGNLDEAYDLMAEYFGLEPDYLDEFLI